jgi:hypothetical protein
MTNYSAALAEQQLDARRKSWSVCPHLSSPEGLFDHYMASGSIMILLGKCFCQDCCEMLSTRSDLTEFMAACQHMTDAGFQRDFIDILFKINRDVFRTRRDYVSEETTRWTWITCSHVSTEDQLAGLYSACNPIFLHQGFVTCNECKEVLPSASLYVQTLLDCEAMTDEQLQERIITLLYPINHDVLSYVGHYRR